MYMHSWVSLTSISLLWDAPDVPHTHRIYYTSDTLVPDIDRLHLQSRDSFGYNSHPFNVKILKLPQLYSDMMFMKHSTRSQSVLPPMIEEPTSTVKQPGMIPRSKTEATLPLPRGKQNKKSCVTYLTEETKSSTQSSEADSSIDSMASTKLPSISTRSRLSGSSWSTSTVPKYMKRATQKKKSSAYSAYYNQGFNVNAKNKKLLQRLPISVNNNHTLVNVKSKTIHKK